MKELKLTPKQVEAALARVNENIKHWTIWKDIKHDLNQGQITVDNS
jgi:hypothetical protein